MTHLNHYIHLTHSSHLTHSKNNTVQEGGKFSTFSQNKSDLSESSGSNGHAIDNTQYWNKLHTWIEFLLKEDSNLLGRSGRSDWYLLKDFRLPNHRTLCSNEFVFDIDAESWSPCFNTARQLEAVMDELNIPFLRYSSGNWLHYHVFFDKSVSIDFGMVTKYYEPVYTRITTQLMQEFLRKLRFGIFEFIIGYVKKTRGAKFDKSVQLASRHMIRVEGTRNEKTGYHKSYLSELPEEQPKITRENVRFPEKIEHWNIDENLIEYVYNYYLKKPEPFYETPFKTNTTSWIERLHETPLSDGRHRSVDLILIPYAKQLQRMNIEQAVSWIREWLDKSYELCPPHGGRRITDSYILSKFRSSNISPLSKENLQKHLADVPEIMEVVNRGS